MLMKLHFCPDEIYLELAPQIISQADVCEDEIFVGLLFLVLLLHSKR